MAREDSGLSKALRLMNSALELIDASGTASDVGAHLDLAIQRLIVLLEPVRECPWPALGEVEQAYSDGTVVGVLAK